MFIFKIKEFIQLERIYNFFIVFIICSILVLAFLALKRPITQKQYQDVVRLSQVATNPQTQKMALQLLNSETIVRADYLQLVQAYQFENTQARHYPAVSLKKP